MFSRGAGIAVKDALEIMQGIGDLHGQIDTLKAENRLLREDRDTWKALALKLSGQASPPTPIAADSGKHGPQCMCPSCMVERGS
jgi:hypothetical protein